MDAEHENKDAVTVFNLFQRRVDTFELPAEALLLVLLILGTL
jgi:hypothetical protein